MMDTDKYEKLLHNGGLQDHELRDFTVELIAEVKQLRKENHNRWVVIGELRRQVEELKDDLKDWLAGEYYEGSD